MSAPREFLQIVRESSLGSVMTAPVAGTDSIYIRLSDSNSFGMATELITEEIAWGGGLAIPGEVISDHYQCKGSLKTKLYASQAPFLLPWLITRIPTGQTIPWTTTEIVGDLASCSIYHGFNRSDGTFRRKRYAGTKCAGGRLEVSRQGTSMMLTLDLIACRSYGNAMDSSADPDATEFPAPADTDYALNPITFKQTGGHVTLGGSTTTQYESLSIAIQNVIDGRWFEQSYLTVAQFCGRKSTAEIDLFFKASPDRRAAYEALTAQAATFGWSTGVTGQAATIQFNGKNKITKLDLDLSLDKTHNERLTLQNLYSASAGEDVSVSFA